MVLLRFGVFMLRVRVLGPQQELVLAPIKTRHAELVVDLVDARTRKRVGSCCVPLAQCGPGPHAVALPADPAGASRLHVSVDFHTSKVARPQEGGAGRP